MNKKQITKFVITGGPCAGKTTAMEWIKETFTEKGYAVLCIPETATELISNGVAPWTLDSPFDYQLCQMKLQIHKEKVFEEAAGKILDSDKILIICDRGLMDNRAYMQEEELKKAFSVLNLNETEVRDSYDAVFHLVTAAKGAEEFYTLGNNEARTETVEVATALDDKLISAWTGHPHFRVIDNSCGIEGKRKRLIAEISAFLEDIEIERKFLIEYPDISKLENFPACKKVEISQTYLSEENGGRARIRQRGEDGNYTYYKTIKHNIDDIKRVEVETRISKEEYEALIPYADKSRREIKKDRYCLVYDSRYFEIDIYPFWNDKAILEIELADENEEIVFPEFIKIIKEVTGDKSYSNASLAMK